MARFFFIVSILSSLILAGCFSKKTIYVHPDPWMVAWNEDHANSYQLTLLTNKNFYYAVTQTGADSLRHVKTYKGIYAASGDSILLNFHKDFSSQELSGYVLQEASGKYLVQYFKNGRRMFLRIQNMHHNR